MAVIWSVAKLAELYRRLDLAIDEYEAYCHHAASVVAPRSTAWEDEALWASKTKQRIIARTAAMLEYAVTRSDAALRKYDGGTE